MDNTEPDGPKNMTRIVRFDPSTNLTRVMDATLPLQRAYSSAVWNGSHAFILGGFNVTQGQNNYRQEILRYDPVGDVVDVALSSPLTAKGGTSAIWNGTHAFIFGGAGCPPPQPGGSDLCNEIVRYHPGTANVTKMNGTLPTNRTGTAAIFDGYGGLVFGQANPTTQILRYHIPNDIVSEMSASLPAARGWTNAFFNGSFGYILTGNSSGDWQKQILKYNLTSGAPTDVSVTSQQGGTSILVEWGAPPSNSYTDTILNYTVRRCTGTGCTPAFYVTLGPVNSYVDSNVSPLTYYCYNLAATNHFGEGPVSQTQCALAA